MTNNSWRGQMMQMWAREEAREVDLGTTSPWILKPNNLKTGGQFCLVGRDFSEDLVLRLEVYITLSANRETFEAEWVFHAHDTTLLFTGRPGAGPPLPTSHMTLRGQVAHLFSGDPEVDLERMWRILIRRAKTVARAIEKAEGSKRHAQLVAMEAREAQIRARQEGR